MDEADGGRGPRATTIDEAHRLAAAVAAESLEARLLGGVAIALHAHSPIPVPLTRAYADLDFVVSRRHQTAWAALLRSLGYRPDRQFNALHGHSRLIYDDPGTGRQIDTFVARFRMCHTIDFAERLDTSGPTLAPVDLLVTKLQIVEINEKDLLDIALLLLDHAVGEGPESIDESRLTQLCGDDWGLTTTMLDSLSRMSGWLDTAGLDERRVERITARLERIRDVVEAAPKSLRWRARARVGRRVPWYELPDEVGPRT